MTASTLSRLPVMAGSVLVASLGRAGQWGWERYMRAPLASTGLMAMVTLTAMAGSNALFFQTVHHPVPFFAPASDVPVAVTGAEPDIAPLPAEVRPQPVMAVPEISPQTTGSVAPAQTAPQIPDAPVGNNEAFAVQKKLALIGLFSGTVDGFYGPMTAAAIRSFEERNGMRPTGAMSRTVVDAILGADVSGRAAVPAPVAAPAPQPVAVAQPAPVQPPAAPVQQDRVVAQLPSLSPVDQTVDTIGSAAAQTLDSLVAAVDGSPRPTTTPPAAIPYTAPQPPAPVAAMASASPQPVTAVQSEPVPAQVMPAAPVEAANNTQLVSQIQRGLSSLGFYRGTIDGHPGDATARAIREFENFHSYRVTGKVNPDLVGLLQQAGATI